MVNLSRQQRKEIIEGYLVKHPNATLSELGSFLGISKQRVFFLLKLMSLSVKRQARLKTITEREIDFLRLIAKGNTNKQIAQAVGVSERAVKNQITIILAKLNVDNRYRAVTLATERKLISPAKLK